MRIAMLVLALTAAPSLAAADVVWSAECPFGARSRTSHAGPRCTPYDCTTDADCEGGLVCQPWRLCTQRRSVPIAGRGAFRDPPPPPIEEVQVVGACAPTESCTGDERPAPPTNGSPIGEVSCAVSTYCVRPPLAALPGGSGPAQSAGDDPVDAPEGAGTAEVPAEVAPASSGACGCRAAARSHAPLALLLAPLALLAARRRR